jgi:hypothetical protein
MRHCCEELNKHLEDGEVAISYHPVFRRYDIELSNKNAMQEITYCPWCGAKFLKPLWDEFWDIIFDELKIDTDTFHFMEDPLVPEEFKSEEWWRKRGL